jgi:8-oxo-dGTP diphosphatase
VRARLRVVAGVLSDEQGRVLLAQRAPGKHLAGLWEFPGGKIESGESAWQALRREWREELDVDVRVAESFWTVPWRYPEHDLLLEVWRITEHDGQPHGRESQSLRWARLADIDPLELPPADRPVLAALRLPRLLTITPEPPADTALAAWIARVERHACDPQRLTVLRAKQFDRAARAALAERIAPSARERIVLHGELELAQTLGFAGVHLSAGQARALSARPPTARSWLGVSCHNAAELAQAVRLDADYVFLGPVHATDSHPGAQTLEWAEFRRLASTCPIPVYALGGLMPEDVSQARAHAAFGVAGISAFWGAPG